MLSLIVRADERGSREKYVQLLKKIFPTITISDKPIITKNTAFIYGDRRTHWKFFKENSIPYILCENDVSSMRCEKDYQEKEMIEGANKILFPSEDFQSYVQKKYKCPPSIVIHLKYSENDIKFKPKPKKRKTVVYCGHSILPWSKRTNEFGYRCYIEIFKEFIRYGWNVHLYSGLGESLISYKDIGCIIHPPVKQKKLYEELSQYTVGFQGYNKLGVPKKSYQYTQFCRPNKLWEYLGAGIPTIGFQGGKGMKLYSNKWGIILKNLEDIPEIEEKIKLLDLEKYRNEQVIEKDLERLSDFVS
jgi:hypothetical protein